MEENKDFEKVMYKIKKQTLTLKEFMEFKNWVCSSLINEEELTVMFDLKPIILQFAFARYYLDLELPNYEANITDDYNLVCGVNAYDYYDFINCNQYNTLLDSINSYLSEKEKEFDEIRKDNKSYSIDNFLRDISTSITDFIDTMTGNFEDVNIDKLTNIIGEFQKLTNNKISLDTFIEHAKQKADEEKLSKEELAETIITKENIN